MNPTLSLVSRLKQVRPAFGRMAVLSLVGLAALAGTLVPSDARAQAKAALVKDVEATGRVPYEYYLQFNRYSCSFNCSNFVIFGNVLLFDAPPVPAGKRLVLQWVSANLPANDARASIVLQSTRIISQQELKWGYYGPFYVAYTGLAGMSSGIFATYGPGETPHINVNIANLSNFDGSVTLAGYLIDATN